MTKRRRTVPEGHVDEAVIEKLMSSFNAVVGECLPTGLEIINAAGRLLTIGLHGRLTNGDPSATTPEIEAQMRKFTKQLHALLEATVAPADDADDSTDLGNLAERIRSQAAARSRTYSATRIRAGATGRESMSEPPKEVQDAVAAELKRQERLQELGFTEDDFGQWKASGCRVTLYSVFGEWEIDIMLPNGSGVGFDVPFEKFHGRTADEIRAARAAERTNT